MKKWNIAAYLRLSSDDEIKQNQIVLVTREVLLSNILIVINCVQV